MQSDCGVRDVGGEDEALEPHALEEVHDADVGPDRDQHPEQETPLSLAPEHQGSQAEHHERDEPEAVEEREPRLGDVEGVHRDRRCRDVGGRSQQHHVDRSEAQAAVGDGADSAEDEGDEAEHQEHAIERAGRTDVAPVPREDLGGQREGEQHGGGGDPSGSVAPVGGGGRPLEIALSGRGRSCHVRVRARRSIQTARPSPRRPPATSPNSTPISRVDFRLSPVAAAVPTLWRICEFRAVGLNTPL